MLLRWAIGFFVVALVAAALGFGCIAIAAARIAQTIFYLFVVLFAPRCSAISSCESRRSLRLIGF
jgi:uncharacterized membrane protein YtjA (UPF0391 family)